MGNPIFHLYHLQKLDSRLDSIKDRLKSISSILNSDARIAVAEKVLDEKKKAFSVQQKKLQLIEESIHAKRMKIEQSEASLYGGGIKNPKELQDLQKEIVSIKSTILSLEESELAAMFDVENAEKEVTVAEDALKTVMTTVACSQSQLMAERTELEQTVHKLEQERPAIVSQISSSSLDLYEELRKKKRGIAVAAVEERCCSLCGTELTPAEFQAAKSPSTLFYCASCGRLLYVG